MTIQTSDILDRRLRANGLEFAYDTFGDPAAPAILLIMGLGAQMISWPEPFCEQLAASGFHVIRFDNRDIGRSTKLTHQGVPDIAGMLANVSAGRIPNAPYLLADMAQDAVSILDALGISSAHIVGASMGGAIGQEVAMLHSNRVRTLTSIMSTSGDPSLPPPEPQAMAVLSSPTPTDLDGYTSHYKKLMKVLRGPGFPADEALDEVRARRAHSRGISPAGVARQFAAILASGSRKERLASLSVPTLVIHGRNDPLVPLACGIDVARAVPGAEMLTVERMGHALALSTWPPIIEAISNHANR